MAVVRPLMWTLGVDRIPPYAFLLLPTATSQLSWPIKKGDYFSNRFYRRAFEYLRNGLVHVWNAVGWVPGKLTSTRNEVRF